MILFLSFASSSIKLNEALLNKLMLRGYVARIRCGVDDAIRRTILYSLSSLLRRDGAVQDQIVMTPSLSAVGMETRQLTEENADFALRDRYHHSSFITTTDKMVHPQSNWACNNCALLTSWTETVDTWDYIILTDHWTEHWNTYFYLLHLSDSTWVR